MGLDTIWNKLCHKTIQDPHPSPQRALSWHQTSPRCMKVGPWFVCNLHNSNQCKPVHQKQWVIEIQVQVVSILHLISCSLASDQHILLNHIESINPYARFSIYQKATTIKQALNPHRNGPSRLQQGGVLAMRCIVLGRFGGGMGWSSGPAHYDNLRSLRWHLSICVSVACTNNLSAYLVPALN